MRICKIRFVANIDGKVPYLCINRIEIEGGKLEQVDTTIDFLLVDVSSEVGTNFMSMAIKCVNCLHRQWTEH